MCQSALPTSRRPGRYQRRAAATAQYHPVRGQGPRDGGERPQDERQLLDHQRLQASALVQLAPTDHLPSLDRHDLTLHGDVERRPRKPLAKDGNRFRDTQVPSLLELRETGCNLLPLVVVPRLSQLQPAGGRPSVRP